MNFWKDYGAHIVSYVVSLLTTVASLPPQLMVFGTHTAAIIGVAGIVVTAINNIHNVISNPTSAAGSGSVPSKPSGGGSVTKFILVGVLGAALLSSLPGCATKLTFDEQAFIGYGAVDSIAQSTDQLLKAGKITAAAAQKVYTYDVYLKTAIAAAQVTYATNQTTGGNALATALTAITTVEGCIANPATLLSCVPTAPTVGN